MITDLEVCRAANQLVKRYDKDAPLECAQRADHFLDHGDPDGALTWRQIMKAVDELLRDKPRQSEILQ